MVTTALLTLVRELAREAEAVGTVTTEESTVFAVWVWGLLADSFLVLARQGVSSTIPQASLSLWLPENLSTLELEEAPRCEFDLVVARVESCEYDETRAQGTTSACP